MKRDMRIIRRIALEMADLPPGASLSGLKGVEDAVFRMHVAWMKEANLVHADVVESATGVERASITRLTWHGCEFIDTLL